MTNGPRSNFDAVTPVYDALSHMVFGQRLERAQLVWLDTVPAGAAVLVLGGGTGKLLGPLLRQNPGRVLFLEASARMLARAGRRMIHEQLPGQVEFRLGTEQKLTENDRFDIIMLPFVLDLFTESTVRDQMLPNLIGVLKPSGMVLVTDFVRTDRGWQRALIQTMIWFFRLTARIPARRLVDWQRLLAETRLTQTGQQSQVWGMASAERWQL